MKRRTVHRMRMKRKAQLGRFMRAFGITAVVSLVCAVVVLACSMVYDAPGLRIVYIYVNGCEDAIAEEVLASAESHRNENIIAADLNALRDRIEGNPWIAQAIIRRQYPDTVAITVSVRKPRAVIALDEEFLVDANGVIFTRLSELRTDLPLLYGLKMEDFEKDPAATARLIRDGLQIISGLQAFALPLDNNVRITCSREFGYTLQTKPCGPEIFLGFDNYRYKLSALPRMLDDLRSRGLSARSIYLHSQERAFVKLAEKDDIGSRSAQVKKAAGMLPS